MKKGLHKSKKVCYDNPRWETGVIFGPVAQLGERTVRIRKVVGSNPFRSTKTEETTVGCLFFFCIRDTSGSPLRPDRLLRHGLQKSSTASPAVSAAHATQTRLRSARFLSICGHVCT